MKVEITHDIIAKKIFERASEDDKNFSRSTRLIKERFLAYNDTKTYLTSRELNFIEPQMQALEATLPKEEYDFIKKSEKLQLRQTQKRFITVALVGVVVGSILLYVSMYYNKKLALWTGVASKTEQLVSDALKTMDKDPTVALNLANEALKNDSKNESAKQVIYLLYRDHIFYKDILTKTVEANTVAISPNNELVAYAEKNNIYIRNVNNEKTTIGAIHNGVINDLCFKNDSILYSVGNDNKLIEWDMRTGKKEVNHTKRITTDSVGSDIHINAIDKTDDGRYILIGRGGEAGSDCLLIDTEQDTTYVIDDVKGRVFDVVFTIPNPNAELEILKKQLMVMVGQDKKILVYDLATRKLLAESRPEDHPKNIYSVAVKPNSNEIVTSCSHDVIRIFNLVKTIDKTLTSLDYTIELTDKLTKHSDAVHSVRFSKDGLQMISTSSDKTAIIWDTRVWEPSYILKGHSNRVFNAEFSQDGRYIVSCGRDEKVIIWNLNLKKPTVLKKRHLRRVSSLAYSDSGNRMYSGTWGNENTPMRYLFTWDTKSWDLMGVDSFDNDIEMVTSFYQDSVLVATGKSLYLLDKKNKTKKVIGRADETIKAVAIAPNNEYIVYAGRDDKVRIIPNELGRNTNSFVKNKKILTIRKDVPKMSKEKDIYSIGISTDSRYIVIGRRNRTIVIWDIEMGIQLMKPVWAHDFLYEMNNEIYSISFIDKTRFITTGRDNTVRLWKIDRKSKKLILINKHNGHAGGIRCLAIHPSKELYVSGGGDGRIKLWDMEGNLIQAIDAYYNDKEYCTGDKFKCKEDYGVVSAISFSKDGNKIIFGNGNGKLKTIYTIKGALEKKEILEIYEMEKGGKKK